MGKRGVIILFFVLLSGLATLLWFIRSSGKSIATDPFSVIPDDACLIIESEDLPDFINSITEGNRLFRGPEKAEVTGSFYKKVNGLGDFLNRKEIRAIFEKNRAVISFHLTGSGKTVPLLSINVMQKSRYRQILEEVRSAGGNVMEEVREKGLKITTVSPKTTNSGDTLFFSFRSGLLLFSTSSVVLENAALHKESGSDIRKIPGFSKIMGAAGRKENKVYIVFRNFSRLIASLTGRRAPRLSDSFARLASCAEADIHISDNGLILSGYTASMDTADYLFKYKSRQSGKLTSYEILPSDVLLFETMLLKGNPVNSYGMKETDDATSAFASALAPFMGNEITEALLYQGMDSRSGSSVVIFKLSNREMAEQILIEKAATWAKNTKLTDSDYIGYFQPDDQTKIPVYSLPFKKLASAFIEGFVPLYGDSVYAFADNYLVAGNSFNAVTKVLYDNILNKTLINDLAYRNFESTLPSRAGYYFYCVPSGVVRYLSSFVNDTVTNLLNGNMPLLHRLQAVGYQFAASNDMIYNTLSVRYGDTTKEASGAEWESRLDTSACIKPFFFTNHNTGAREIFIQDLKNNVYLINSAGRVLWKVSPGEKILGSVYMIDYFGNGKYQLLFAGRNNLYLLDRNGNYVERFPVKLRSPATGPPAMFDYDGTGDIRIVIPGEDRLIYAYDKSGNVVKGWKPFRTGGRVKTEIRFYRISGKDYLIVSDDKTIYFLDRTGNQRLRLKEPVVRTDGSEIRLDNNGSPSIVFTSPDGTITRVSFDGTVTKTSLRKFSIDHSFDFFDIDGDGVGEYVFIDRGILYLYESDKSEVFTRDFGSVNVEGPVFFIFSNSDRKIGITDLSRRLVYLVDKKGNNVKGFPLKGASVFSIGKLSDKGDFRLIVGGEDNFLYNYRIETGN